MAKPREALVWPPRPPDPAPFLHLQRRLGCFLEAAALQTPSRALSPAGPLTGPPAPVTPRVSVLQFCRPARVTQARGRPHPSADLALCRHTRLPRATAARGAPRTAATRVPPSPQQLSSQARVPAAQEGWGHVEHPGAGRSLLFLFVFLFSPFFLSAFRILIKCAHRFCAGIYWFLGAQLRGTEHTHWACCLHTSISGRFHLPNRHSDPAKHSAPSSRCP